MYYPNFIEEVCYQEHHINKVLHEINKSIPGYFQKFIDTENGTTVTADVAAKISVNIGATSNPSHKPKDPKKVLERILKESIADFESDRKIYQDILHPEALAEYGLDKGSFKNTVLKNLVPIIRKTLQNRRAEELDKYRKAFNYAKSGDLYDVVHRIVSFAEKWKSTWYNSEQFEKIKRYADLDYNVLDKEDYTSYGVIGGGIKSAFLYKLYPYMFSNRSRSAIWALWYLTEKKQLGCKEDSEFLMINIKVGTTQQNYFYPYALFSYYALQIYIKLKSLYAIHEVSLPIEYRFVVVEKFLTFIAHQHQNEIELLKQDSQNYEYEY